MLGYSMGIMSTAHQNEMLKTTENPRKWGISEGFRGRNFFLSKKMVNFIECAVFFYRGFQGFQPKWLDTNEYHDFWIEIFCSMIFAIWTHIFKHEHKYQTKWMILRIHARMQTNNNYMQCACTSDGKADHLAIHSEPIE